MTDWIIVNTQKINRIGYNPALKVLYVDFNGSQVDIPFTQVSIRTYKNLIKAKNIDNFFEENIQSKFNKVIPHKSSTIDPNWNIHFS